MATNDSFRRGIVPKATDDEVHSLVWCCTPYPFRGDLRKLRRSIRRHIKLGGGTIAGAIDLAYRELDEAMAEFNRTPQGAGGGE